MISGEPHPDQPQRVTTNFSPLQGTPKPHPIETARPQPDPARVTKALHDGAFLREAVEVPTNVILGEE